FPTRHWNPLRARSLFRSTSYSFYLESTTWLTAVRSSMSASLRRFSCCRSSASERRPNCISPRTSRRSFRRHGRRTSASTCYAGASRSRPYLRVNGTLAGDAHGQGRRRAARPESCAVVSVAKCVHWAQNVRPCCAFGTDLKVKIGSMVLPGYEIENVVAADDIGQHNYDQGPLLHGADQRGVFQSEKNGLLYT